MVYDTSCKIVFKDLNVLLFQLSVSKNSKCIHAILIGRYHRKTDIWQTGFLPKQVTTRPWGHLLYIREICTIYLDVLASNKLDEIVDARVRLLAFDNFLFTEVKYNFMSIHKLCHYSHFTRHQQEY